MYRAIIDNQEYKILDFSASYKINTVTKFNLEISYPDNLYTLIQKDIEIYKNKQLIISGYIDKRPIAKINKNKITTVKLNCLGEMGRLTLYKSKFNAHYQNSPVLTILNDLISTVPNWTLQIVNFLEPTISTTIDLRSKETLFSQIIEVVKSVPDVNVRYGGIKSGNYVLQVGSLGDKTHYINSPTIQLETYGDKEFTSIAAYGNNSAGGKITLEESLLNPNTLNSTYYNKYKIQQDIDGEYIIVNTNSPFKASLRKSFNVIKTKNDEVPTLEQITEAAYALYLKAVRFLESSGDVEVYNVEFVHDTLPQVGDNLFLNETVKEPVLNEFYKVQEYREVFDIQKSLQITSLSLNFSNWVAITKEEQDYDNFHELSATVSNSLSIHELDNEILLYEKLEKYDEFDDANGQPDIFEPVQTTSVTHDSSDTPDCTINTTNDAKTFTVPSPAPPSGATSVSTVYSVEPSSTVVANITPPASVGANFTLCAKPAIGSFPPTPPEEITVTVYWLFT